MSNNEDIWFDSSLYEAFVYHRLHQNEILKNTSLIATYQFWNNASNIDEDFPNNILFKLTSSANFTITSLSSTFSGFKNENSSDIVRNVSIISLSENLMLGDYIMNRNDLKNLQF